MIDIKHTAASLTPYTLAHASERKFISTAEGTISYIKYNGGEKNLICFHGFGQNATNYAQLANRASGQYTVYSFDLYFHGESTRKAPQPMNIKEWEGVFQYFLRTENIDQFEAVGFSLGGKFAILSAVAFPQACIKLHLLAPDGIRSSLWYELATFPGFSPIVFKRLMSSKTTIRNLLKLLSKIKMLNQKMLLFGQNMTETELQRRRLYMTWTCFKPLRHKREKIINVLNEYKIPCHIYVGKHDLIMKPDAFDQFLKRLNHQKKVTLPCGHHRLLERSLDVIVNSENS